jgi:prolyl 4-hydroxylase
MLRPHKINDQNNFIAAWYNDDFDLIDRTIDWFESNPEHQEVGTVGENRVDHEAKRSTEIFLYPDHPNPEIAYEWVQHTQASLEEYLLLYPKANNVCAFEMKESIKIQRYLPGQGYPSWHCERDGGGGAITSSRHLVFITYLNDLHNEGGETEFLHQKLKVRPEKGLTLIWPTDWTFVHRGVVSESETKYIVTGWYNF